MPITAFNVQQQITSLRLAHPDLFEGDEEDWLLALESETDLDALLTQIVYALDDAAALETGTKERLEALKARKDRFARKQEALRNLAFKVMDYANVVKVELPIATLSMRGVPPSVVITNEENLPDIACKFKREPDKTKIKELLETGPVAGAEMNNGSRTLSIRIK